MCLITLPEIQGVAVNRLPNLLGAGGAHRTIFLVVVQTGFLEIQLGMRKQLIHLSVEILNDLFILDREQPARENTVPVVHQAQIVGVVTADILQRIGELLTPGKQLLEVGKSRRHGMAPRINNRGLGQDGFNERHVLPVVG